MGIIGVKNKENIKYSEETIQRSLRYNFLSPSSVKYFTENLNIFNWESDVVKFTKSGYVYEFEIKISKADFKNDFKNKKNKHAILENSETGNEKKPNYFYYVVPKDMITVEDVPEYAGLIYVIPYSEKRFGFLEVKKAPILHKTKFDFENSNLMDKFYYNYIHWKQKHETDMENYKSLLEEVRTCEGKTYNYTLPQAVERIKELEKNIQNYLERSEESKKLAQEEIRIQRRLQKKLRELGVSSDELEEIMGVRCVIND